MKKQLLTVLAFLGMSSFGIAQGVKVTGIDEFGNILMADSSKRSLDINGLIQPDAKDAFYELSTKPNLSTEYKSVRIKTILEDLKSGMAKNRTYCGSRLESWIPNFLQSFSGQRPTISSQHAMLELRKILEQQNASSHQETIGNSKKKLKDHILETLESIIEFNNWNTALKDPSGKAVISTQAEGQEGLGRSAKFLGFSFFLAYLFESLDKIFRNGPEVLANPEKGLELFGRDTICKMLRIYQQPATTHMPPATAHTAPGHVHFDASASDDTTEHEVAPVAR